MKYIYALALGAGLLAGANPAADLERVGPGKPAPAFTLPDAANKPHSLVDYAGEVTVLVFYRGQW